MKKQKFYAYSTEGKTGVTNTWAECLSIVSGKEAKYKSFESKAEAERWLEAGADYAIKHLAAEEGIYFDAGTGAGKGVQINVTDQNGKSLLHRIMDEKLDSKGHYTIPEVATNNFGELLASKYALQLAIKDGSKKIFGDSKLILDYWSKGYIKKEVGEKTVELALEVKKLRYEFEKAGGQMIHISGGSNPADLGYHKN
ncbi:MAG: viroplasmin family protein [Candidatus Pacebacteria bacterium]|nr:viroplasmin family protein [Candidatus Paceibacterota bacterium]